LLIFLELIGPADDRGYSKFNRSAIRFSPDFGFSKIGDDELFVLAVREGL
jgi:hypothetical protein